MNWMQVEDYLRRDDRCVVPLGSTEQHAYLSLSVDSTDRAAVFAFTAEAAAHTGRVDILVNNAGGCWARSGDRWRKCRRKTGKRSSPST